MPVDGARLPCGRRGLGRLDSVSMCPHNRGRLRALHGRRAAIAASRTAEQAARAYDTAAAKAGRDTLNFPNAGTGMGADTTADTMASQQKAARKTKTGTQHNKFIRKMFQ